MLLADAILTLLALAGTAVLARATARRERSVARLGRLTARHRDVAAERARFARTRDEIVAVTDGTARAVTVPTEITRRAHAGIAAIPFTVLEQIPATAPTSRVVRQIHDEISRTVYDAVSGTARGVAGVVRGNLTGRPRPGPRPSPTPRAIGTEPEEPPRGS